MGGKCRADWEMRMHTKVWLENLKKETTRNIPHRWKQSIKMGLTETWLWLPIGLIWLRIGTCGELLRTL
jgi:hypothetical protein